ncbi:MAG: hypothetical protein AMXMBFR36_13760 [Acidobacteriota bacterium]
MSEVTELLIAARDGEPGKLGAVFEVLYPELRRLASWRSASAGGAELTTTALVHETYLKLVQAHRLDLKDRRHFFACAARAMRHILVDHARETRAAKRGSGVAAVALPEDLADGSARTPDWIDLDRALDELDGVLPELRELVELRYYAGLSREETAELLSCSERTVQRNWQRARAFLHARLADGSD